MRRVAVAGLVAVVIAIALPVRHLAVAEAMSVAAGCPNYQAHLRSARTALEHGDRTGAAAELRRAQKALECCMRENAGENGLAARSLGAPTS